jgi:uncharacterized membrane protein
MAMIPRKVAIAIASLLLLLPLANAQEVTQQNPTMYVPDIWSYVVMNPLTAAFIVVFIVLVIIILYMIVEHFRSTSHEDHIETALVNQEIQNMIMDRNLDADYMRAIIRQINANAAVQEQVAVTLAVTNTLLAGQGGVEVAKLAREITQPQQKAQ